MTIKELEQKTGMTRANIRFYEGEGLLAPKRLDNGYRDYSEEDARTLEKIRLLRRLQLDLDAIRKVQRGTLTLDQALFVQQTKLEGDRLLIQRAAEVCRELGESGVEYGALDPKPYLARLDAPPAKPNLPPPPRPVRRSGDDAPQACYHPWQRWLARMLDMTLYDTVLNLAWLLIFRDQSFLRVQRANLITAALSGMALLFLALALEPLWLHFWGWTPGKWIFGLKLRDKDGEKLSIAWGIDRSKTLAWEGYGWNIPLYSLWVFWRNRKDALEGWNGSWNGEHACRYTKEERRFGGWVFAGAYALCAAALLLGLRFAQLPVNRGELTVAEFARNYNHFYTQVYGGSVLPRMGEDGRWAEGPDNYGQGGAVQTQVDGVWIELEEPIWDEPEFTVEDGHVTAVTLRVTGGCLGGLPSIQRELLAMLALSGSTENWSLLNPDLDGWLTPVVSSGAVLGRFGDGETCQRGLRVSKRETMRGYQETGELLLLAPIVGEEQYYERVVTISLE